MHIHRPILHVGRCPEETRRQRRIDASVWIWADSWPFRQLHNQDFVSRHMAPRPPLLGRWLRADNEEPVWMSTEIYGWGWDSPSRHPVIMLMLQYSGSPHLEGGSSRQGTPSPRKLHYTAPLWVFKNGNTGRLVLLLMLSMEVSPKRFRQFEAAWTCFYKKTVQTALLGGISCSCRSHPT